MAANAGAKRLYLVDGTSQLYRAYYALPSLTNADGLPTHAVYGFTTMLRKLIQDEQPALLGVAFDPPGEKARHRQFAEYKANRPETPGDLRVQLPYAKQVCEVMNVPVLEVEGYEADDLIATLAHQASAAGYEVVVVASDKDLLQLVDDRVTVLNPSKELRLDAAGVADTFGVPPERVPDVLGLMGDSVDNIPGVPGVGEKTAVSMISAYGPMDAVVERAQRFARTYAARDGLLEAIDALQRAETIGEPAVAALAEARATFATELAGLLERELDTELGERLQGVAELAQPKVDTALSGVVGQPGKKATPHVRALKKGLKEMERKSARRAWIAVAEHADQALLSRELATVDREVPAELDLAALKHREPDHESAYELFLKLDFRMLLEEMSAGAAPEDTVETRYATVLELGELRSLLERCRRAGRLAVHPCPDVADPLRARWVGVGLGESAGAASYVPLAHTYLGVPRQITDRELADALAPLLADPEVELVAHDVKRTMQLLERLQLRAGRWATDPMVGAFLLASHRRSFALPELSEALLGAHATPDADVVGSGRKARPFSEVELDTATQYGAQRADLTLRLAEHVDEQLRSEELTSLYDTVDGPLLGVLATMETRGIRVDTRKLAAMSSEMETSLDTLRSRIHKLAGSEFNVDSPKQLREVLFERLALKPRKRTAKSGVHSTDAQTLELLAEEHEMPRLLLEYRELAKLKGTYVDALPQLVNPETGRVHTRYHPTGAATGRLSSSDPNLQNIPVRTEAGRRIRGAFVPADGHLFLSSDYSQVELRVLAHMCGDEELIAAFRSGEDIHRHTAARVFGVDSEAVSDAMRRRAKAVNFGILYGMSATRLAREQGMERKEAVAFIDSYFERFSSVREYIEAVRERAVEQGWVGTLLGRVRHFPELRSNSNRQVREQSLRAAVNTTIQGTAADIMKVAMLRVASALEATGSGARMLLQVHDELLFEVPEDEVDATREQVREAMESAYELSAPLAVDQAVGASWKEAK